MPGRDKPLITRNGIPDPQAYNPQTGQWESFIGVSWGKTAGGLYVPIRVDDQGRQEVTLSGNIATVTTIANAVSLPPGGNTGFLNLGLNGKEKRVFVMVNSDQTDWTVYGRNMLNGFAKFNLFPRFDKVQFRPTNTTVPYIALYLPLLTDTQSEAYPTNWLEANALIGGYTPEGAIRLHNEHASNVSTVTIKVLREL